MNNLHNISNKYLATNQHRVPTLPIYFCMDLYWRRFLEMVDDHRFTEIAFR